MNKKLQQLKSEYGELAKRGLIFRAAAIPVEGESIFNDTDRTVRTVLFTENPAVVIDWHEWEVIREILICTPDACVLPASRTLPLLDNHMRYSSDDVKGQMRNIVIENNEFVCDSFISATEEKTWLKIKERTLTDVSGGYRTDPKFTLRILPGESGVVNGRTFKNDFGDDLTLVVRSKWTAFEGSVTPIGADVYSKFRSALSFISRRAKCAHDEMKTVSDCCECEMESGDSECPECGNECSTIEICSDCGEQRNSKIKIKNRSVKMTPEERAALEAQMRKEMEEKFGKREVVRANVRALAGDFQAMVPGINLAEQAEKFIKENGEREDFSDLTFRSFIMDKMKEQGSVRTPASQVGMSDGEVEKVSFREMVLACASGSVDKLGVAYEASRTLADKLGREQTKSNILLPFELMKKRLSVDGLTPDMKRDLNVAAPGTGGGYTVQYQYLPQSFIEILTNNLALLNLGATQIDNCVGNIPMTRELSSNIVYWLGEGTGPTQSDITFSQQIVSPKTVGALTKLTHKFLLQNSVGGEAYAMRKIGLALGIGIDKAGLYGTGDTQPTGAKLQTGLGGVVGAGFNRAKALNLIAQIKAANALTLGSIKWLTDPTTWAVLANRDTTNVGSGKWLWDENNKMVGFEGMDSNQVEAGDLFGGMWSSMMLFFWNVAEIKANEFGSGFSAGQIEVRGLADVDTFVEYPGALTYTSGVN